MVKRSQSIPAHIHAGRRRPRGAESSAALADVEARFGRFRAEHAPGTRVPRELREAAVAALRAGVAAGALYRTCGISWSQLETWKAAQPIAIRTRRRTRRAADVRVFSVVDAKPDQGAAAKPAEQDLELRLGRWSVRVRLADPARGE
jgi:hypothetical protein